MKFLAPLALAFALAGQVGSADPVVAPVVVATPVATPSATRAAPPVAVKAKPTPRPAPPHKPKVDPISDPVAVIEGPTAVRGTFALKLTVDPSAQVTARHVLPNGAQPPIDYELRRPGQSLIWMQDPPAGVYVFRWRAQVPVAGLDPISDVEHTVTVGDPPPPTPPVPPGPNPPGPTPPPVTVGARHVIIIYETMDVSIPFKHLLNEIRDGDNAKYLDDHKHTLDLVDDDAVKFDGSKAKILETYAPHAKFPRSLIVADSATGAVLGVGELTDESTAAGVMEFIKKNGG